MAQFIFPFLLYAIHIMNLHKLRQVFLFANRRYCVRVQPHDS